MPWVSSQGWVTPCRGEEYLLTQLSDVATVSTVTAWNKSKWKALPQSPVQLRWRKSSPDWRFWFLFLHSGEWAGGRREQQGLPWGWGGMKTNIYVFKWGEEGLVKSNLHSFRRPRVKKESLPERKNPPPHFISFFWGKFTKAQNSQKRRLWNNIGSERRAEQSPYI